MSAERVEQIAIRRQPYLTGQSRVARKNESVVTDQGEIASRRLADFRVKSFEILRQHRSLNDAGETSIGSHPAAAYAGERRSAVWRPWPQNRANKCADVAIDVGLEVIAVGKIDHRHGITDAVDQPPAVPVKNQERFHLGRTADHPPKPNVQLLLIG